MTLAVLIGLVLLAGAICGLVFLTLYLMLTNGFGK